MEKDNQGQLWEVFLQTKPGMPFKHAGSVHGYDKEMALENARDVYTRRSEAKAIWIVPSSEIVAVSAEENESYFAASDDKVYRHPTFYDMPEGVKHM